jgi:hypothetical protein
MLNVNVAIVEFWVGRTCVAPHTPPLCSIQKGCVSDAQLPRIMLHHTFGFMFYARTNFFSEHNQEWNSGIICPKWQTSVRWLTNQSQFMTAISLEQLKISYISAIYTSLQKNSRYAVFRSLFKRFLGIIQVACLAMCNIWKCSERFIVFNDVNIFPIEPF